MRAKLPRHYEIAQTIPHEMGLGFPNFFFHEERHVQGQSPQNARHYYLIDSKRSKVLARYYAFVKGSEAFSPGGAPFGSLDLAPELRMEYLETFWDFVEDDLQRQGVQSLRIKSYPFSYAPYAAPVLHYFLLKRGYACTQLDLNYHLEIGSGMLQERMHPSLRRKLQKPEGEDFRFSVWQQVQAESIYAFLAAGRSRKGYPVSLGLDTFARLLAQFPEEFLVFLLHQGALHDADNWAALTVAVKVNENILYNFYPVDAARHLAWSPLVHLHAELYAWCQSQGYQQLDLGIATDGGAPNYGLMRFKKHLGARETLKPVYFREFGQG